MKRCIFVSPTCFMVTGNSWAMAGDLDSSAALISANTLWVSRGIQDLFSYVLPIADLVISCNSP